MSDTLILNQKVYSKSNRTQQQKYMCITNWGKLVLQIGAALFYYKLGQTLLQIGAASLLQIGASVVTNWGSYYKLGQLLLQNRRAITNRCLRLLDLLRTKWLCLRLKELLEAQVSMFLENYSLIKFANLKFLIYITSTDMFQFSLFRESRWIWEKMFTIS